MRADTRDRGRIHKPAVIGAVIAGLVFVALALVWLQIDWAWSPVDDAGHVLALNALMDESGPLLGMARYAIEMFEIDLDWGLFRPSYWLYPSLFYLLPTGLAHVVRLLMIFFAIAGPLVFFYRQGIRGAKLVFISIVLVTAASPLFVGLVLVSLQELSAMAFIGVGLLIPNRWTRWILWVIAAWFKAPFAWLLVGQAVADWQRGDRKLAVANGATGIGTLGLAALMSRTGSYTSNYTLDPYMIWFNAQNLLEPVNVVVLVLIVWWLVVQQGRLTWTPDTTVFAIGWIGYTAQLLPWSVTAYYMGPITFLFGLTLVSMLRLPGTRVTPVKALIGWSVPAVLATVVVTAALSLGFRINGTMVLFQDCLADRPGSSALMQGNLVYVTTSSEAPFRLSQNLTLLNPDWEGRIDLRDQTPDATLPEDYDLLLNTGDPLNTTATGDLATVCENSYAQGYERSLS